MPQEQTAEPRDALKPHHNTTGKPLTNCLLSNILTLFVFLQSPEADFSDFGAEKSPFFMILQKTDNQRVCKMCNFVSQIFGRIQ